MNKKIILLLLLIFIIPINVKAEGTGVNKICAVAESQDEDWTQNTSLKLTEIQITKQKSVYAGRKAVLESGENNGGKGHWYKGRGQGFAASDNYYLLVKTYDDSYLHSIYSQSEYPYETNGFVVINKQTNEVTDRKEGYSYGHANDATWNSKTDTFLVINAADNENNNIYLEKFKVNTSGKLVYQNDRVKLPLCITAIAYNEDDNNYIVKGCLEDYAHNTVYFLDSSFKLINNKGFDLKWNHLVPGGLGYSNGYIYIPAYESGKQSIYCYYNSAATGSNIIYQYDLNGNFIKTLYIPVKSTVNPSNIQKGELQTVTVDKNRNIYAYYDIIYHDLVIDPTENEGTACPNNSCVGSSSLNVFTSDYLAQAQSMSLTSNSKKIYLKNSTIDKNNTFLKIKYNDGNTETNKLSDLDVTITGFDSTTTGKKTVTITYKNKEVSYSIYVVDSYSNLNTNSITRIAHLKKGQDILSNSNMRYQSGATLNNSDGIRSMTIAKVNNSEYIYFTVLGNSHSNTAIYKMTTAGSNLTKGNNAFLGSAINLTYNKDIDESNGGVLVSGHTGNECCNESAQSLSSDLSSQCTTDVSQYSCGTAGYELYNGAYNQKGIISYIAVNNSTPFVKRRSFYPDVIKNTSETPSKSNEAIFSSIAYDKNNKIYYARRGNYLWILNSISTDYEGTNRYPKENATSYALQNIVSLTIKDWAYYKGLLYLIVYGGNDSNIIMAYNLKGNLETIYKFPESSLNTNLEISGIDFDENGNMYLGFNNINDDNYVDFYKIQTPTTSKEEYLTYNNQLSINNVNTNQDIIKNLQNNTTIDSLLDKISSNTNYQILNKNNEVEHRNSNIKTGTKINYLLNNQTKTILLSVTGDVTGTGTVTNDDVEEAFKILKHTKTADEIYTLAADTTKDGELKINDIAKLYQYTKNKIQNLN